MTSDYKVVNLVAGVKSTTNGGIQPKAQTVSLHRCVVSLRSTPPHSDRHRLASYITAPIRSAPSRSGPCRLMLRSSSSRSDSLISFLSFLRHDPTAIVHPTAVTFRRQCNPSFFFSLCSLFSFGIKTVEYGVKDDKNKAQKNELVKGLNALKNQQNFIAGRGKGRGRSDQPHPSHSCTSPPPPHTLPSQGLKDDKNKAQKNELVKGLNALKKSAKFHCSGMNNLVIGEDEEMWLRQQEVDANNVTKCTRANSEVSNNSKMSSATSDPIPNSTDQPAKGPTSLPLSGGSHVETDRRKVIYVDATCNPRRFVPQSVTRDIISDANRSNRAALPDSMLHTGGSICLGEHKRRMEAELKHPVSYRDVYDHIHKKKDGEYVSQRSKNFIESYDIVMLEKYGEDTSKHPIIDSEVWAEVSGPKKKRRILGGHNLDVGTNGSMDTSSSKVIGPSRTLASTQEDIKEAVNIAMTSFVQIQLLPMLEPILSMIGVSQISESKHHYKVE